MSLVPGLQHNLRSSSALNGVSVRGGSPGVRVHVGAGDDLYGDNDNEPADKFRYNARGAVVEIEHPDGSISISTDGRPIFDPNRKKPGWFDNLVDEIDEGELSRIANDILRGVDADIESRKDWVQQRTDGIKLLGLSLETSGADSATDGAPLEGMSRIRHPLLQEALLRFQAGARSEMLPTDGPAKVRNDSNNSTVDFDRLADALEKDLNHYLTVTATEFVPDTDRMLLMLGFGGTSFKKVYYCPLRNRPVSEHVDAEDLIVNNDATDLKNAKRVTHSVMMRPSTVKRLQILGVYRDIELGTPLAPDRDNAKKEKMAQQGVADNNMRPEDRDRHLYECYCELDVEGFEHKHRGKVSGLEIPYRVTIDVSSKEILSIVRNYDEETKKLPEARVNFVKYTFVPGFGFYDIGLLHILGNSTAAATAAWRELLDLGMFANFPGFLIADLGMRQDTNVIRVPPGGGQRIKTNGMPIKEAIMPLPYNMQSAPTLMALVTDVVTTGQRVGGAAELPVGEGRADSPVGTTLALIEGAMKVTNSVHKRMHAAQAEEIQLIGACFKEHPQSFWQMNRRPAYPWDAQTFLRALDDCNLVPQSDPNTASQIQRLLKLAALKALQTQSPSLYDPIALDKACIRALGFSNPEQFMAPASAMGQPPPELVKMQQEGAAKMKDAEAKVQLAQARTKEVNARAQYDMAKIQVEAAKINGTGPNGPNPADMAKAQAAMMNAQTAAKSADLKHADIALRTHAQNADRHSEQHVAVLNFAKEILAKKDAAAHEGRQQAAEHAVRGQEMMAEHVARQRETAMNSVAKLRETALEHSARRQEMAMEHAARQRETMMDYAVKRKGLMIDDEHRKADREAQAKAEAAKVAVARIAARRRTNAAK